MEFASIINEIRNKTGIRRHKIELTNIENAISYFCEIANSILEAKGHKFDFENTKPGVMSLIEWLYTIENTNTPIDFNKGILFKGKTGRGKTFLFKVFSEFIKIDGIRIIQNGKEIMINPRIINSRLISGEYQDPNEGGYRVIEKYSNMNCLVIDDIGSEQTESMNFGNKENVVAEIIRKREENSMLTFGTTNLNRMNEVYDERTRSRMNALFNVININHELDYRINKTEKDEN